MEIQLCQICHSKVDYSERYPNSVCNQCASKVKSKNNLQLSFYNTHLNGGFQAEYTESKEPFEEAHICYIDDIKCWADESHMDGIVIETYLPNICYNKQNIKDNLDRIKINLGQTKGLMDSLISKSTFDYFYALKFEKIGSNSFNPDPSNLIEQINQTFSNITTFLGLEYLMDKHGEQIFYLNLEFTKGYDILSKDGMIACETFSAVNLKNNDKLKSDIEKLSKSPQPLKYVFYYSHDHSTREEKVVDSVNVIQFSKDDLIRVLSD
ncbi:hypothetical protein [Leptospira levettii]|uniref:hypothetical protein n=1 Tax=Leptospira levettii TaxID=2023178 RepID=UPI000F655C56|nr:hypothetical protein [Leptospira levettii]